MSDRDSWSPAREISPASTPTRMAVLAVTFLIIPALAAGPLPADTIESGTDAFTSPPPLAGSPTEVTLTLPQGFFGPGSDLITPTIQLEGEDLRLHTGGSLPADTLVERTETANLTCGGTAGPINIELVALDLRSTDPIPVTFNGGPETQLWDLQVCLSSDRMNNPSEGMMTITQNCQEGGTFDSEIDVLGRFIFTRVSDGETVVLDPGPLKSFTTTGSFWVHDPMGIDALEVPGSVMVDRDCDGVFETAVQGTTNFYPGIQADPCSTCMPITDQTKTLVPTDHQAPEATHGVLLALGVAFTIPTLSQWGLILVAVLLALAGAWVLHRRRRAQAEAS